LAALCRAVRDRVDYFHIRNSLFRFSGYVEAAVIHTMFLHDKHAGKTCVRGFAAPRESPPTRN